MRKLFSIVLAVLLVVGIVANAQAATPGHTLGIGNAGGEKMGSGKYIWQAHKTFRLVRYMPANGGADTLALSKDSIVIWDSQSDDGMTVTTTTTSGDAAIAGVIAQTALTPDSCGRTITLDALGMRNFTWLQTYGYANVLIQNGGTITVKDTFGTSALAGYANSFAFTTGAVTGIAGFGYDTLSAATTSLTSRVEVFLRCE